jgi:hypothetical protein
MLRRIGIIAVLSLIVAALAAVPALAQNPHFVKGPTASDLGTQLRVAASVAGLGNENIDIRLTAQGTATVTCTNPGGNVAPGQNTSITATGSATNVQVKNGRANFTVTTATPTVPNTPTCPNAAWTATVTDVTFTSYRIEIFQPATTPPFGGTLVLDQAFTL